MKNLELRTWLKVRLFGCPDMLVIELRQRPLGKVKYLASSSTLISPFDPKPCAVNTALHRRRRYIFSGTKCHIRAPGSQGSEGGGKGAFAREEGYSLVYIRAMWERAATQGMFFGIFVLKRVSISSFFVLNKVSILSIFV